MPRSRLFVEGVAGNRFVWECFSGSLSINYVFDTYWHVELSAETGGCRDGGEKSAEISRNAELTGLFGLFLFSLCSEIPAFSVVASYGLTTIDPSYFSRYCLFQER